MSPFDEYFHQVTAELSAASTTAGGFDHDSDAREVFLDRFLGEVYPDAYLNVGGEIIDASGETSNRTNVVFYDQHLPVLAIDGRNRYLSAGVHAHLDVKADLFGEIDRALSKVDSIKRLDVDRVPVTPDAQEREHLFSAIVAFDGPEPEIFKETVLRHYANRNSVASCVDLICVLEEYVMVTQYSGRNPGLSFLRTGEESLATFFLTLAGTVMTNYWNRRPILSRYMDQTEAEQF